GEARCGDTFRLLDRPAVDWPLSRVQAIIFSDGGTEEELQALSAMPFLATPWRAIAMMRLDSRR
ncbi:sulfurase, partial [Raoultella planticola]